MSQDNKQQIAQDLVTASIAAQDGIDISSLTFQDDRLICILEVSPALGAQMEPVRQDVEKALITEFSDFTVNVILTAKRGEKSSERIASQPARIENLAPYVKHMIAVASGKGGVGKSTVAVNLAVALAQQGLKVGLMDADIYGPSVPKMMGLSGRPQMQDDKLVPHEAFGVKVMSIGFMVEDDTPMIWRGPMIQSALRQFMVDVDWGELDVMIVDMPPGTGDAQLTMAQKVPLAGAVIVSTPQDVALLDARKGVAMFRKTGVPVLGLIENMSMFTCPECGHESHIFGHGGAEREAKKSGTTFLGAIPLELDIRIQGDEGMPITQAQPHSKYASYYQDCASTIMGALSDSSVKKASA